MDQSDMNLDSTKQQSASQAASPIRGPTAATRSDEESLYASKKRQVQRLLAELDGPTASKKARRSLPTVSTPQAKSTVSINPMVTLSSIRAVNTTHDDKVRTDRKHSALTSLMIDAINLPPQVPNVFSSTNSHTPCQCTSHQCSRGCISAEYLDEYGWEYRALLKESEGRSYPDPRSSTEDADPQKLLTLSGISPPPENRTREQTQWASPRSINWDLDDYMERQADLAPRMRAILIDWVVELSEEYKLSDKSFHLAVTLIDLSLASFRDGNESDIFAVPRDMLQCLGWYVPTTSLNSVVDHIQIPSHHFPFFYQRLYPNCIQNGGGCGTVSR
jgi:Cyclin, N-terminal domain